MVLFGFGVVDAGRWPIASRAPSNAVRIAVSALLLGIPGVLMGMAFPLGMRLANAHGAGADAVAVGHQRRDLGVRVGPGGGDRAQHDHLDGVLGRLALLRGRPRGLRLADVPGSSGRGRSLETAESAAACTA